MNGRRERCSCVRVQGNQKVKVGHSDNSNLRSSFFASKAR